MITSDTNIIKFLWEVSKMANKGRSRIIPFQCRLLVAEIENTRPPPPDTLDISAWLEEAVEIKIKTSARVFGKQNTSCDDLGICSEKRKPS